MHGPYLVVCESSSALRGIVMIQQAGGGASRNQLVSDRISDFGELGRVDDVVFLGLVEFKLDLRLFLRPGNVPGSLEVAFPGGLAGFGVLLGYINHNKGVIGAIDVHVEVEGGVVVMDDADQVLRQEGPVQVLFWSNLVHVRVGRSLHH